MNDWRYDYAINDTGDMPLIDLRADVKFVVTLDKLMVEANDAPVAGEEPCETDRREASRHCSFSWPTALNKNVQRKAPRVEGSGGNRRPGARAN